MKRILIISAYFYPDIEPRAFRTTSLAEEFIKRGYDVTLCIPYRYFDYTSYLKEKPLRLLFLTKRELFPKLPTENTFLKKGVRWLFSKVVIYTQYPYIKLLFAIPKKMYKLDGYDLMLSIAAPHAIHWGCSIAIKLNKQLCEKWIADCGDPFMGDETVERPFYFKYFEVDFCRSANYITIPIREALDFYYPSFNQKIRVIPQGFDFSNVSQYKKTRQNECPTFAYAGAFYANYRDPTLFLTYLSSLKVDFKFIIYTGTPLLLGRFKDAIGDKLIIHEYIPREKLLIELAQMDFVINIENKGVAQLPSKLIDYALVKRPIFLISTDYFNDKVFQEFLNGNYSNEYKIVDIEQYDIQNVADRFLEL